MDDHAFGDHVDITVFHTGLAAAIGLMVAGQQQVMDDLFDDPTNGDEE